MLLLHVGEDGAAVQRLNLARVAFGEELLEGRYLLLRHLYGLGQGNPAHALDGRARGVRRP